MRDLPCGDISTGRRYSSAAGGLVGFSGVDFLGIEDMLSEDERAVRDLVRGFVDEDVLPIIEQCAYEGRFPKELIPKMAAMNLFGSTIAEYGLCLLYTSDAADDLLC